MADRNAAVPAVEKDAQDPGLRSPSSGTKPKASLDGLGQPDQFSFETARRSRITDAPPEAG
jgi:hypothetical protein